MLLVRWTSSRQTYSSEVLNGLVLLLISGVDAKCDLFADLGKNAEDKGASGPRICPCSVLRKRHIEIRAPGGLQGRTAVA